MITQHQFLRPISMLRRPAQVLAFALVAVLPLGALSAELAEQAHSLRAVPADTAFYSVSLRLKEQWDAFSDSRTYSKLMQIPLVQLVKQQAMFQFQQSPEAPIAQIREYFESDAGQDSIALLKEMVSDEVFAYGGGDLAQSLQLLMEMNSMRQAARIEAAGSGDDVDDVMAKQFLEKLKENPEKFKVPTLVLGFRIENTERAKSQLDEVHSLVRNVLDQKRPELASHLQREQIAGHEFLTLRLDGSQIPWDEIREEADEEELEQIDDWREVISEKKMVVALGVTDKFVLLSIGESSDHLEKLGQGTSLADRAEIKRLEKHAGERVAGISYMSQEFARSVSSPEKTLDDLVAAAEGMMDDAEISAEQQKLIVGDIRAIDIKKYMPAPGATSAIAFLTERGYEGFQYNSVQPRMMDSSKPLSILDHVGGTPALLLAGRSKQSLEDYQQLVDWLKQTVGHVEQIAEEKADPEDWAKYLEIRPQLKALLARLDKANRENVLPALEDGESAFVLDVSAKSKKWFDAMPESPKALPMLEAGFIVSVSDPAKMRAGAKEYLEVAEEAMALAHQIDPDVEDMKVPDAEVRDLEGGGELFVWAMPEAWGVDEQVAVTGGLNSEAGVLSTMTETTNRLLQTTPLEIDSAIKLDRPAATVMHIEISKFVSALRPWIDYGFDVATGKIKPKDDDGEEDDEPSEPSPMLMQMGFVVPQIHQLLDVASALKSATAVTYEDDGLWVTHSETHFVDGK